jgi:hypothetical protein
MWFVAVHLPTNISLAARAQSLPDFPFHFKSLFNCIKSLDRKMAVPSSSTIPLKLSGSPTPPEPCHVCLDLNLGKGSQQNYWYETRDATYKGVVAGAEAGCRGCKVLQFAVRPKFEEWGTHSIELIIMQRRHETSVWVGTNSHFHNSRATRIELYKLLGQDGGP